MPEAFAPSLGAAASALAGKAGPIVLGKHPGGHAGAKLSLDAVAQRVREGKDDPRVRAWAGRELVAAGSPRDDVKRAQALLEALRKKTTYAPDPVGTEMVVAAKTTLCLDDHGLCMPVGDCDDLTIALGSALMSVGIPIVIVGQAFDGGSVPTHVLLAIESSYGRLKIDPSSPSFPVGRAHPATREWYFDPMESVNLENAKSGTLSGKFIGIGESPLDKIADMRDQLARGIASLSVELRRKRYLDDTFGAVAGSYSQPWLDELLAQASEVETILSEAVAGLRRIADIGFDTAIESREGDKWSMNPLIPSQGTGAIVLALPWIAAITLAIAAGVIALVYKTTEELHQANVTRTLQLVSEGKISESSANRVLGKEEASTLGESIASAAKWLVLGGGLLFVAYEAAPFVRKALASRKG